MRLIDADKLMRHLSDWALHDNATEIRECMEAVKEQPTVDPVKHGRWIEHHYVGGMYFRCSNCNAEGYGRYCQNCGAMMDEEE